MYSIVQYGKLAFLLLRTRSIRSISEQCKAPVTGGFILSAQATKFIQRHIKYTAQYFHCVKLHVLLASPPNNLLWFDIN
jgi:hypothetical protein